MYRESVEGVFFPRKNYVLEKDNGYRILYDGTILDANGEEI